MLMMRAGSPALTCRPSCAEDHARQSRTTGPDEGKTPGWGAWHLFDELHTLAHTAPPTTGDTVREGCSCNAWVRGTTRQVLRWRAQHTCPDRPAPEGDLHIGTGALIENAARREYHGMEARIGFQREG